MASPFDDDPEDQQDGSSAVISALSGADEEQEQPSPVEADEQGNPQQDIEYQKGAQPSGEEYAQPAAPEEEQPATSSDDESAADYGAGGSAPEGLKAPTLPQTPNYADNTQNMRDLEARYAKFNPADYKPSVGRRIAAALSGGAVAFGSRNPAEGMKVAEAVNDAPLNRARAQLDADARPIQQRINDTNAQNQTARQQYADASSQYGMQERDMTNQARIADWNAQAQQRTEQAQAKLNTVDRNTLGPVDPKNPFGEWQGRTPGGQVVRGLEPPAAIQKSPAYIRQQRLQDLQDMDKNGIKLTPEDRKFYFANGKLAQPTERTTVNIRENPDGSAVQPRGGAGGAGPTKNLMDRISATKDAGFQKAQTLFQNDGNAGNYQANLQEAQNAYEHRLEGATGNPVPHTEITVDPKTGKVNWGAEQPQGGGQAQAQPQAQQPPAQPQQTQQPPQTFKTASGKTLKPGDPVVAPDGRKTTVKGIGPTGKLILN